FAIPESPVARLLPSGLNVTRGILQYFLVGTEARSLPAATSQNVTLPSPPDTRMVPSGENRRGLPPPLMVCRCFSAVTSHSLMPQPPPEARIFPSGENATKVTLPLGPYCLRVGS